MGTERRDSVDVIVFSEGVGDSHGQVEDSSRSTGREAAVKVPWSVAKRSRLLVDATDDGPCRLPLSESAFSRWMAAPLGQRQFTTTELCDTLEVAMFLQDATAETGAAALLADRCDTHLLAPLHGSSHPEKRGSAADAVLENLARPLTWPEGIRRFEEPAAKVPAEPRAAVEPVCAAEELSGCSGCMPDVLDWSATGDILSFTSTFQSNPAASKGSKGEVNQRVLKRRQGEAWLLKQTRPMHATLDIASHAGQQALAWLPAAVQQLSGYALDRVLQAMPIHAVWKLPPALRLCAIDARCMNHMLDRTVHAYTRFRSLEVSGLTPVAFAQLMKDLALLPPVHSLSISHSDSLDHPTVNKRSAPWSFVGKPEAEQNAALVWLSVHRCLPRALRELRHLKLTHTTISRGLLHAILGKLTALETLEVDGVRLRNCSREWQAAAGHFTDTLSQHTRLKSLTLDCTLLYANHRPSALSLCPMRLTSLTGLTSLSLGHPFFSYLPAYMHTQAFHDIGSLIYLRTLDIHISPPNDQRTPADGRERFQPSFYQTLFRTLATLPHLSRLRLPDSSLLADLQSRADMAMLRYEKDFANLTGLTSLDISFSERRHPTSKQSPAADKLGKVRLCSMVTGLVNLRELVLGNCGLGLPMAVALVRSLEAVPELEVLNLNDNKFKVDELRSKPAAGQAAEDDTVAFVRALLRLRCLRALYVSGCGLGMALTGEQLEAIGRSYLSVGRQCLARLEVVDLSNNVQMEEHTTGLVEDSFATLMAEGGEDAWEVFKQVTEQAMVTGRAGSLVGDMEGFGRFLGTLPALERVNLSGNMVSKVGAKQLVGGLGLCGRGKWFVRLSSAAEFGTEVVDEFLIARLREEACYDASMEVEQGRAEVVGQCVVQSV